MSRTSPNPPDTRRGAPDQLMLRIDEGLELLERERQIFMSGRYGEIDEVLQAKTRVLGGLEELIRLTPRSVPVIEALRLLIRTSRRNELLIKAAQQGLAHARRRIDAILKTGRGAVAYAEDGSAINSRADLSAKSASA